jgi:hypothetical protein
MNKVYNVEEKYICLKAKSGGRRAELIFQVLNKVSGGEP